MAKDESGGVDRTLAILGDETQRARKDWWMFFLLGILMVLGGVVAIACPLLFSVGAVVVLGIILMVSGIITIIGAFWAGKWSALMLQLLVGILYVMTGMAIRDAPVESTALLTMFVAAFFIVVGVFRIIVSLVERFPQWGWALLNGVVTLLAGVIIYDTFPYSALWLIGLLVGLELLLNGWTWIMLSMMIRNIPETEESTEADSSVVGAPSE